MLQVMGPALYPRKATPGPATHTEEWQQKECVKGIWGRFRDGKLAVVLPHMFLVDCPVPFARVVQEAACSKTLNRKGADTSHERASAFETLFFTQHEPSKWSGPGARSKIIRCSAETTLQCLNGNGAGLFYPSIEEKAFKAYDVRRIALIKITSLQNGFSRSRLANGRQCCRSRLEI